MKRADSYGAGGAMKRADSFGADGGLMPECGAAFPPEQRHYCVMSPHMVEFVRTPLFVFNSRCATPPPSLRFIYL